MNYLFFADVILVVHAILIIGVFVGILLSVIYKRFRPIEASLLLIAIVVWSVYGGCPLTSLENYLRIQGGNPLPLMEIGFIPYYLKQWFNLQMSGQAITVATYVVALVFVGLTIEWEWPLIKRLEKRGYKIYRKSKYK